jgi:hypothetical protein
MAGDDSGLTQRWQGIVRQADIYERKSNHVTETTVEVMKTWLLDKDVARPISNGVIAWRGRQIRPSEGKDRYITLYRWTWENPRPDTEVERIDFESSMGKCAPFLLGITVEP